PRARVVARNLERARSRGGPPATGIKCGRGQGPFDVVSELGIEDSFAGSRQEPTLEVASLISQAHVVRPQIDHVHVSENAGLEIGFRLRRESNALVTEATEQSSCLLERSPLKGLQLPAKDVDLIGGQFPRRILTA